MAYHFRLLVACAFAVLSTVVQADDSPKAAGPVIREAVFQDVGVNDKVVGLLELLRTESQLQVGTIKGADVRNGTLDQFDVVVFPGGSGSKEAASLDEPGRNAVRTFVDRGGGFVGICAGAYLASADYDWSLHILDAKVIDRAHWARGTGDVEVTLTDAGRKLLGATSERETILYW